MKGDVKVTCPKHGPVKEADAIRCVPDAQGPFWRCPVAEGWDQCGRRLTLETK